MTFYVGQTNSGGADLIVSTPLVNECNDYGNIGTASSLIKTGLGMMALTGSNYYTGNTKVSAGTLEVSGNGSNGTYGPLGNTIAGANTVKVAGGAELLIASGNVMGYGGVVPTTLLVIQQGGLVFSMLRITINLARSP